MARDLVDDVYCFLLGISDALDCYDLGKFVDRETIFNEPQVFHGVNMHGFYTINSNGSEIVYVRGNLQVSDFETVALTAKIVSREKVIDAAKTCSMLRARKSLFCEIVEGTILKQLGKNSWKINEYYTSNDDGVGLALTDLIREFYEY